MGCPEGPEGVRRVVGVEFGTLLGWLRGIRGRGAGSGWMRFDGWRWLGVSSKEFKGIDNGRWIFLKVIHGG